ncbi:MAG: hypothetical protein UW38_C0001G0106 [Candidatus Saccharibacteria bacterium GW2011_GWC2_44_17]|nr:MAG: hypothetical protein UW38_C0001G0106 [Candidatus Saccharibacteria bacterium GW2011_GWC2_44_17]MBH1956339.1 hypothetical protein [Candidatus Saccharibacteria bacterium]MBH1972727.1 hypothetical protein [Candidatus Saccharibacteria bacterium]MBH1990929.1 hypothetical protein [Candidatus Saccharibacteria bacterium]
MSEPVVYEFGGEIYENSGEFLDALAHEYKVGDQEAVIDVLEQYGFERSDIGA